MKNWEKQKDKDGAPDICPRCSDTGAVDVPNGPDDTDQEYCDCQADLAEDVEKVTLWEFKTNGPLKNSCSCGWRGSEPVSGCPRCNTSFVS